MNVCVPYTRLQLATEVAVRNYSPKFHAVGDGPDAYVEYFRMQWAAKIDFINVEHDVVPWPGSLELMASCLQPWCAYGYSPNDHFVDQTRTLFPYLGCVKFTAKFITATPHMWEEVTEPWDQLDRHVAIRARECGLRVHQHRPPVVNANPVLLGR